MLLEHHQEANLLKLGGRSLGRKLRRPEVPQTLTSRGGGGRGLIFHSDSLFVSPQRGKPEKQRGRKPQTSQPSTFVAPKLKS